MVTDFNELTGKSQQHNSNPKMSISFFDDVGGLFCILVDFHHSDHSANHQKLNVTKK